MSDHIIVPPHVYDQLHPDAPAVKRRADQAETNRQIAALITAAATKPPRPNRAERRRRR